MDGLLAGVDEAGRGPLAGPVVASAVASIPEIIEHDAEGLLHAEDDIQDLDRQIRRALDDPTRARDMARAARATKGAYYAPERMLRETSEVVATFLDARVRPND